MINIPRILQSKDSKYSSAAAMIVHLGELKDWWINGQYDQPTGNLKPEHHYNKEGTKIVEGYKNDHYIEIARFAINNYSYELNFKGRIELDKSILEVIRTELPILKGMNIVFYDVVNCFKWSEEISQSSKQIYLI